MNDSTLVRCRCSESLVDIWTISRRRKAPHRFAVLRSELQKLEEDRHIIVTDLNSFADLRLWERYDGIQMLTVEFTWLSQRAGGEVSGWSERVHIPYERLHEFAISPEDIDGCTWDQLSVSHTKFPRIEMRSRRNLHEVVKRPVLRHKLAKIISSHFQWPGSEKIIITDDSLPFSFFFEEIRQKGEGICGGIILHDAGDLRKAHYSVHT